MSPISNDDDVRRWSAKQHIHTATATLQTAVDLLDGGLVGPDIQRVIDQLEILAAQIQIDEIE